MKRTLLTLLTLGLSTITVPLSACGNSPINDVDDYDNPEKYKDYYSLDTTYGLEVYAWNRGNDNWRCSLAQSNANGTMKSISVVKELYPVSLKTMRNILDSYIGFNKNENVIVCVVDYPLTEQGLIKSYRYEKDQWNSIDYVRVNIGLEKMFN